MRQTIIAVAAVVAIASACSDDPATGVAPNETAATTPPHLTTPTTTQRTLGEPNLGTSTIAEWEFNGTVIDSPTDGSEMCPGMVLDSYPPRCSGIPVVGLDWSDVPWAEAVDGADWAPEIRGTRWASVRLVGTYDGETFALTRPPGAAVWGEETPFSTPLPCDEPAGGWQVINEGTADRDGAAVGYAQAQPEFMGNWSHRLPADAAAYSVKVFTFTDKLDEHEQAIRDIYGGPLCVSLADRSLAELEAIRNKVKAVIVSPEAEAAGIYLLDGQYGDTIDVLAGTVEFYVLAADTDARAWLEWQIGESVVSLHSLLTRVGQP